MGYDRLELVSLVQGHLPYFQNYMYKGTPMASKKRKPEEPSHAADPSPESAMQAKETADDQVPAQTEGDTDIGKKIQDVIEREYPRTRIGTDGWLQAILCELIRARLSK